MNGRRRDSAVVAAVSPVLTYSTTRATIVGMTTTRDTTDTAPRRTTRAQRMVEAVLQARWRDTHPDDPDITLAEWVRRQRNLGVAWRPMAPKLQEITDIPLGYESLRRWFPELDDNEDEGAEETPD